jgi:hypothetical protein
MPAKKNPPSKKIPAKKNQTAKKFQNTNKINSEESINKKESTSEDLGVPDIGPLLANNHVCLFTHESAHSSKLTYPFQCSSLLILHGNCTKGSIN